MERNRWPELLKASKALLEPPYSAVDESTTYAVLLPFSSITTATGATSTPSPDLCRSRLVVTLNFNTAD